MQAIWKRRKYCDQLLTRLQHELVVSLGYERVGAFLAVTEKCKNNERKNKKFSERKKTKKCAKGKRDEIAEQTTSHRFIWQLMARMSVWVCGFGSETGEREGEGGRESILNHGMFPWQDGRGSFPNQSQFDID